MQKKKIYTLIAEVGRSKGDGLPKTSSGAALICYASGIDEAEAVRETIAILKVSGMSPLSISGYGNIEERIDQGHDIEDHEYDLMDKATKENSVVISQVTPFFED